MNCGEKFIIELSTTIPTLCFKKKRLESLIIRDDDMNS